MDNKHFDIKLNGRKNFEFAMQIACSSISVIKGWSIYETEREGKETKFKHLVLHWCVPDRSNHINKLPFDMSTAQATEFAWGWLEKEPVAYSEPDHDGENGMGFHIFTEGWGQVNGDYSAFVAMKPIWAMYGK